MLLLISSGCEKNELEPTFTFGQASDFRLNQLYTSADGQYKLMIKEISDSRCPEGVVCVWAGEVTIKGEWSANKQTTPFEIHSVVDQGNIMPEGITIKISAAKPYPKYGTETKPEDLVITLLIQKN
jgi:hypothetical protein